VKPDAVTCHVNSIPRTAIVTGAGGFVGRHLCVRLRTAGMRVQVLARPGSMPPAGVEAVPVDPASWQSLRDAAGRAAPEFVFHLAGTTRADDLHEVNVEYASRILDAVRDLPSSPVVVVAGSAAEYGRPVRRGGVVSEDDECRPVTAYGASKLAQTRLALAAAARGQQVVVARLFNPIGPGSPATNAAGAFVRQIASLRPAGGTLVTGPVDAIRDFTGVTATVDALIALAQHRQAHGRIVNVCSGRGVSMAELVATLLRLAPVPIDHRIDPGRGGTSSLPIVVGDPSRLAALGVSMAPLDLAAELGAMLAHASASLS
jgi:GDP-4-dehydro-6-deoxy-D-mannose reductase